MLRRPRGESVFPKAAKANLQQGWYIVGTSVRSVLGFENEEVVFERYRAIREVERLYV